MEGGQAGAAQEPDADARRVVRTLLLPANPPVKVGALFDALGTAMVDENASGTVVVPRSPADLAGASPGTHIVALNGYKWSKDLLHDTLAAPPDPTGKISLLVQKDDMYKTLELNYSGGERYPTLLREPGIQDLLGSIAHSRAAP